VAGDAAGRACKSVAQQGEPAKAWRSRKSLQKRGAAERACKSVAQQAEPAKAWRSRKSLHKRGTAQEPRQAWRAKITLSIIGGLGNNISGETTTNHNHLERIDTADETVSQYKAYDAIHLSENADEQKPDNEPTRNIGAVCMTVHISTYHQQFKILIIYKRRHMTNEICTHILHIIHNTHAT
jgi:hypothetical protein